MKKNILLVEDETILREMLDESLTGKGYEVTAVGSVASALNKLDANDFDAIVTDIKLPEVTGIEFLHSLQEKTPETPVIIMTGYPSMGIAMEALKNGASDFLPKPFRAEVLDSSIQKAIKVNKLQRDNLVGLASKDESQLSKIVCSRLENKIKELSLISTVNDALYSIRDKEVLFDTLMELSFVITDFDNAFIMVVDRESGRVIVRNDTFENTLVGKKFSTNEEPFCSLLKDGKVFYEKVYDGILLPLTDSDKELEEGVPVFMCPVALGDNALIILGVSGASNGQAIGEEENSAMRNLWKSVV